MMYPYPQTFNHQTPANSHTFHYQPCFESMAPKTNHPSFFGHLPCPNPAEHYYPPGYSYPHFQPPPQPYYHAPYPPYPDPYPACFAPPPRYSLFNHPQYEYDKAGHHCCNCPNHTCHRKDDTSPKIEENKLEKERDGDSIGLVGPQNYPYPVMLVPPNFDKENWNGWVPLDVNSLKGSKREGEEKKQSPLPVIWMPGHDKPEEPAKETKEINPPPSFKIVPLELLENAGEDKNPRVVDNEPKSRGQPEEPVEKERRIKTIPVMKLENKIGMPEKPEKEKADEKKLIALEKQKEEGEVQKASEKKQASNVKSPKLPPVCLRVDPLPRRKKTNGTSRSPSPPGCKGEGSPRKNGQMLEKETGGETSKKKDILVTHIRDGPPSQEDNLQVASLEELSPISVKDGAGEIEDNLKAKQNVVDVLDNATTEEKQYSMEGKCAEERTIYVDSRDENVKENKKKRILSQLDAAITIQSAFRGFEVRKWQPLEKLQKIARIREQMGSIRRQIESIEGFTRQQDAMQRTIISETIMNLLLQLDTIQGLHPSVREARKSVARELTCLQEKLDSLGRLVNVEHEAVKVENNLSDQTSDDILSSEEANLSTEQESLETIASIECTGAEELAKVEENSKDEASDVDVSPSFASKPISELKSMQPADANIAVDESVMYEKIPPLATEPTSEEKLEQVSGGEQIGEQPALEENAVESLKETAVEELDEPVLPSSIEASLDTELMSKDLCRQEGFTNLACVEEVLHLPHVNAFPDETALIGSSKEVISQEHKEEEEKMVDYEASDDTNHEPQKPPAQPLEVENNIVEAVTTPGEETIDHDKISSLELQKDALDLKEEMNNVAPEDLNGNNSAAVVTAEKKLIEENEKLKDLLEKLLEEGKGQLGVINRLNGRVKELERKLTPKKRVKVRRNRPAKIHSRGILC